MYHLLSPAPSPRHCDEKTGHTHTGIPFAKRHVKAQKHIHCFCNSKQNLLSSEQYRSTALNRTRAQ